MKLLSERNRLSLAVEPYGDAEARRAKIKQELRQRIQALLQFAKDLPPEECLREIKARLLAIQQYCLTVEKTFVVVEEQITCDQHELGGSDQHQATLFRGPSEDASVAICVTQRGSLLHRNGYSWTIYRDAGDVPAIHSDSTRRAATTG